MNIADIDIRDAFFDEVYTIASQDPDVIFLTADMGAFSLNRFKADLSSQYINVGVAEQNMISVGAGLALGGKKVAGVMLESINTNTYVLGIGINCHQKKRNFPKELRKIATSIDIESSGCCDRVSLARRLLTYVDQWFVTAGQDSQKIIDRWRQLSTLLGHRVTIEFNSQQFCGNCIGIDPAKGLILQLERGGVRMFDAAHTTIVK